MNYLDISGFLEVEDSHASQKTSLNLSSSTGRGLETSHPLSFLPHYSESRGSRERLPQPWLDMEDPLLYIFVHCFYILALS